MSTSIDSAVNICLNTAIVKISLTACPAVRVAQSIHFELKNWRGIDMAKRPKSRTNNTYLRPTMLAACIGSVLSSPALAQDTTDEVALEEVTVYGTRAAIQNAQAIKRDADTFVDAISASDISALPDVSVLEALQRVPGITIERFAAPNDPDHFSTEGSGATLRGLPQTRSAFNGRDTFSANSGRGLAYQDIAPELLGAVKIFKNQTADMVEGGISGTVDLITRKPFDGDGQTISFSAKGNRGDLAESTTPSFSGLYSNRFDVAAGELGFLVSYADSSLDFRSDGVEFGRHGEVNGNFVPINGGIRSTDTERDRLGASASVQFANNANTFSALAEYIRSDSETSWNEHAFFSDDNGGQAGPDATFTNGVFSSGTIVGIANGLGPQTRESNNEVIVEDFSLALEFTPTERLGISGDVQFVDSTTDIVDLSIFGGMLPVDGNGISASLDSSGSVPNVVFNPPPGASADYFSNPANYFWRAAMDHIEESEGDELALALDLDYDLEFDFARSIEAGVRFAERDQTTRWSTYNWGNLSEAWNGGFATFDGAANSTGAGSNDVEAFTFSDFHGNNAGGLPGNTGLFPASSLVGTYDDFLAGIASFGRTDLASRGGAIANTVYTPAEINSTNEETQAAYVKLNFGVDGDNRLQGNVGLRYVSIDTAVDGGFTLPTLNANTAQFASAEELAFANGFSSTAAATSDFSKVLPSLNVKYEVTPDLIARFGYSQSVAYPLLGSLRYNFNVSANVQNDADGNPDIIGWRQISGNPFLEPMESQNLDLSAEYYFANDGFFSVGVFYKDIDNFFANDTQSTQVTNPSNGAVQTVDISAPVNLGNAKLRGLEVSYNQFFSELPGILSGLGVQFNYTYLKDSDVPNQNLRIVQSGSEADAMRASIPFEGLPLQGLSENSFNLVGLFQNDKIDARLAYNWRDDYLLTIRQVNLGLPVFAEDRGQLDGSAFYRFNDNWQFGIEATNLLQEEQVTTMQADQEGTQVFRSSFVFDRRFSIVARASF